MGSSRAVTTCFTLLLSGDLTRRSSSFGSFTVVTYGVGFVVELPVVGFRGVEFPLFGPLQHATFVGLLRIFCPLVSMSLP